MSQIYQNLPPTNGKVQAHGEEKWRARKQVRERPRGCAGYMLGEIVFTYLQLSANGSEPRFVFAGGVDNDHG